MVFLPGVVGVTVSSINGVGVVSVSEKRKKHFIISQRFC